MIIIDDYKMRLNKFREDMTNLYDALKIDAVKEKLRADEELTAQDGFWNDMERSQKVSQEIKNAKDTISDYEKLERRADDLATLIELAEDGMLEDVEEDIVSGFPEFEHGAQRGDERIRTVQPDRQQDDDRLAQAHIGEAVDQIENVEIATRRSLSFRRQRFIENHANPLPACSGCSTDLIL